MMMWLTRRAPSRRFATAMVAAVAIAATTSVGLRALDAASAPQGKDKAKPKLSMRASPAISFSPARIFLVAELKGGPNDYEEFYCASVEWDWGDLTTSESSYDCEPYEAGKSEIRRRFAVEHVYKLSGAYQIEFKLKRKDKVLSAARTTVQVRPGLRDIGG